MDTGFVYFVLKKNVKIIARPFEGILPTLFTPYSINSRLAASADILEAEGPATGLLHN